MLRALFLRPSLFKLFAGKIKIYFLNNKYDYNKNQVDHIKMNLLCNHYNDTDNRNIVVRGVKQTNKQTNKQTKFN